MEKPKVVILCGGVGTRLKEETEYIPKPLVKVGNMPILWHIMKIYSHYGYNDFILCLGYKGDMIKEFFLNFELMTNDFTLNLRSKKEKLITHTENLEDWNITFADTGLNAQTGARIKKIEKYVNGDLFFTTYGDGVSDVNINALLEYHKLKGKIATLTGLHPVSKFGALKVNKDDLVTYFREKPFMEDLISGGFFVFEKKIFDYLTTDDDCILERKPFEQLAKERQVAVLKHDGFWRCVDTYKDLLSLNEIYTSGNVPWMVWKK